MANAVKDAGVTKDVIRANVAKNGQATLIDKFPKK